MNGDDANLRHGLTKIFECPADPVEQGRPKALPLRGLCCPAALILFVFGSVITVALRGPHDILSGNGQRGADLTAIWCIGFALATDNRTFATILVPLAVLTGWL